MFLDPFVLVREGGEAVFGMNSGWDLASRRRRVGKGGAVALLPGTFSKMALRGGHE